MREDETFGLPKHKPPRGHGYEAIEKRPEGENELSKTDQDAENDGAKTDAKHTIQKKSAKHRENDIRPGVEGVEESVAGDVYAQHLKREEYSKTSE